ncbi:hypothetical protein [Polyangium aurulentum]|uniref:hypothetical protein n=1 Tax=Polyangium aurulentum TaxID=2567896 RepID=UPI0010AE3A68|nr:hypothetical protein [Polyangium aurulentum]UQA57174.1 hypothetical protein E8A73_038680 [Polyangium aurulentum]
MNLTRVSSSSASPFARASLVAAVSSLLLLAACSSTGNADTTNGGNGGNGNGGHGGDGGGISFDPSDAGDAACADNVRPIFVLTQGTPAMIHSFDPQTLTFAPVQKIECPDTKDWVVASMSVDRNYRAWVEWGTNNPQDVNPYYKRLDRIDLATGACTPNTGKLPDADHYTQALGMAFVSDSNGSSAESLFFIDKQTKIYPLGATDPIGQWYKFKPGEGTTFSGLELTGTGAGRLFAFVMNWTPEWSHPCTPENPCGPTVHIGEVSTKDGSAISNEEVTEIPAFGNNGGGFAFAHWGGLFWVFEALNFGPTHVYKYDPELKKAELVKTDGPNAVVGAGVSTCAPLTIPK